MSFELVLDHTVGDCSLSVNFAAPASCIAVTGPSGTGKTTLLNCIAGLITPASGKVVIGGRVLFDTSSGVCVPVEQRGAGYVFQEARLFPHMRVRANLLYGVRGEAERFEEIIGFLGIGHLLDRWPRTLSGGEAQRVAIGRALLSRPRFLLLDEPLSSLDRARREEIMLAIEHVRDVMRLPILMVTHDPEEAERIGNRVMRM